MAKVIIINGYPQSGKDQFVTYCTNYLLSLALGSIVHNVHTSYPAKEALRILGWDGVKDAKSRNALAAMMGVSTQFYDGPFKYVSERIARAGANDIVFVHVREWANVQRYKKEFGALTLFIDRHVPAFFDNPSDNNAGENKHEYDWQIDNDFTLTDLKNAAERFMIYHI